MTLKTRIKKSEVNPGEVISLQSGDLKIVSCNVNGSYFALEDICSHDDGVLVVGKGTLTENCQLECPRHGARFDVKTGKATKMPAVAPIKSYKINTLGDELEILLDE